MPKIGIPVLLASLILFFMGTKPLRQAYSKTNSGSYAIAKFPTPVWNTPTVPFLGVGKSGKYLAFNDPGYINELEFIALPRTVFKVKNVLALKNSLVYQVTTDDYQYHTKRGYFIDGRFVENEYEKPQERPRILLPQKTIMENLVATRGSIYTWGGNYHDGIPQIFSFYQPPSGLTDNPGLKNRWMLKGVDCSGLLYEATNGYTPRNTVALLDFGISLPAAGLNINQIVQKVKPLDIIVWPGHVIVVLDQNQVIESRPYYQIGRIKHPGGVKIRQIKEVLSEISRSRVPVNSYTDFGTLGKGKFVIRRWYGQRLSGNIRTGHLRYRL